MSIVKGYRDQFAIAVFDGDLSRGTGLFEVLQSCGFNTVYYSDSVTLIQGMEAQLPHLLVAFYQPLSLTFRKNLQKVREQSPETEIVLLGSADFWPGIHNIIVAGLAHDFWSWPLASPDVIHLRVDQYIEKIIYKYIGEQREGETAGIIKRLEEHQELMNVDIDEGARVEFSQLEFSTLKTETELFDRLIAGLKTDNPDVEFAYLKFYQPKSQLVVYKTSFSSEGYTRGQFFPYTPQNWTEDQTNNFEELRSTLNELFLTEEYRIFPTEFSGDLYGFVVGFNCPNTSAPLIERAVRYASLNLRNRQLEKKRHDPQKVPQFERQVDSRFYYEVLSREISRARRVGFSVSVILLHLEYRSDQAQGVDLAMQVLHENTRVYDFYSRLNDQEIALVLPHEKSEESAIKAERLRRKILSISMNSQNTPVRLCLGVATFPSLSAGSDELMDAAKDACDQVLVSGLNKVCLYTQSDDYEPEFQV